MDRGIRAGDGAGDLCRHNQGHRLPRLHRVRLARVAVRSVLAPAREHTLLVYEAGVEHLGKVEVEVLVNGRTSLVGLGEDERDKITRASDLDPPEMLPFSAMLVVAICDVVADALVTVVTSAAATTAAPRIARNRRILSRPCMTVSSLS